MEAIHKYNNRSMFVHFGASLLAFLITVISFVVISFIKFGHSFKKVASGGTFVGASGMQVKSFNEMLEEKKKNLESEFDWKD